MVLLGAEYWVPLLVFLRESLLASAAISVRDFEEILVTNSPEGAVAFIQRRVR